VDVSGVKMEWLPSMFPSEKTLVSFCGGRGNNGWHNTQDGAIMPIMSGGNHRGTGMGGGCV
jgi:hypothetical protein